MPEKISIVKESGETVSSNIVSVFTIPDTEKKYIITTENSVDPHGLTVLHVSEIVDGSLKKIATDEEWSSIKTIMRAIISGNVGSYKYLPTIEAIKADGQYSRDISVSASASKQMIDNYNAADKKIIGSLILSDGQLCINNTEILWKEFSPEDIRGKFVQATKHLKRRKEKEAAGKKPMKPMVGILLIIALIALMFFLMM